MHSILSLVQRYLLSRAGSTVIGLFVVISLIWFAGPSLGLTSVVYRLAIIGAIAIIALAVWLVRRIIASRRGARLQDELSAQGDSKAASKKLEIQLLKEKMNEAITSLKSSELGARYRGNAALYALPWYMIIGPSAAGKSTLLRQSGLDFPYASDDDIHIQGYGGTRNCDWWFSDQAVFLDTAGRYTTEDDDRDEWLAFLGMLRKHRKKMPVNGVLVAVSLAELLTTDREGLDWHVKVIRNRISELIQQLGMVFPVYLVFTKSDLLHGFEAFFEDLSEQERNQVWGAYLYDKQEEADEVSDVFEHNLNNLYTRLCDMRLRKVSMQRNLKRKSDLFDFPSQFGAAAEKLNEFINLLFKDNPYQETPQFAGVYFTSAIQEGTPIERVIGNLRQAFGFAKEGDISGSGKQRPFFIKNLFTDVIFQIQGGAKANRKKLSWDKGLRTAAVLLSLLVVGGAYLLFSGSYATNVYLLNQGVALAQQTSAEITGQASTVKQRYAAVVNLYRHLEKMETIDEDLPWVKQVALYQANEQMTQLQRIIDESLYLAYWVPATQAVEHRLNGLSQRWQVSTDEVREQLRPTYYETLMLYLQLTRNEHFDYDVALKATTEIWQRLVFDDKAPGEEDLKILKLLSRLYLEPRREKHEMQLPSDERLIAQAREQLHTVPDPNRLYALLLSKGGAEWLELSIKNFVTGEGKVYLTSNKTIPGIYSSEAWYRFAKSEIESMSNAFAHGDWVMEDTAAEGDQAVDGQALEENAQFGALESAGESTGSDVNATDDTSIAQVTEIAGDAVREEKPLKGDALAAYLEREIRSLYFKDYGGYWMAFLASFKYQLPKDLADKSMALMHLSSEDGPIAQISTVIADNTRLYETRPVTIKSVEQADGENLSVEHAVAKPKAVAELADLFSDLQRFSVPEGDSPISQPVSDYLEALSQVYGEVDGLAASVDVKRDSERFAAALLSGRSSRPSISKAWVVTTTLVNSVKKPARPILKSLLSPPISMAWSGIVGQATSELQQEWSSSVVRPYKKLISGKFPFTATGDDAALADVAEFYHPQEGILWKFANERLSPYLRKTSRGWVPRRWLGVGANFSRDFLRGLSEAQKITDALYTNKNEKPNMTFYLQPDPSSDLREMQIESNGQLFRYRNGPQVWQRFDWPGDMNQIGARVMGVADHGRAVGELRADGPWGLFHLLKLADISKVGNSTHYKTSWDLPASDGGTVRVAFKLRADRQDNIFNFKLINSFRLPMSLFKNGRSSRIAAY
ncbi:MAG: type VI secretion system membrane subunit TssM [Candidatus Thiodiazotropha sp. (ex Monitilora ramsayi)]|nr:type VI secretion system membrane subunit TssM [Candidatus Thiodiazotropha sp. (ex Monitilora ramsayi)]